jgi:hypothetical protein
VQKQHSSATHQHSTAQHSKHMQLADCCTLADTAGTIASHKAADQMSTTTRLLIGCQTTQLPARLHAANIKQ